MDAEAVVDACLNKGLDDFDANVLSRIFFDEDLAILTSDKKNYLDIRNAAIDYLKAMQDNKNLASISLQEYADGVKDKNDYGLFLDILVLYYQEVLSSTFTGDLVWEDLKASEKEEEVPKKLQVVLETRDDMRRNPNMPLLFDRMIYKMRA